MWHHKSTQYNILFKGMLNVFSPLELDVKKAFFLSLKLGFCVLPSEEEWTSNSLSEVDFLNKNDSKHYLLWFSKEM